MTNVADFVVFENPPERAFLMHKGGPRRLSRAEVRRRHIASAVRQELTSLRWWMEEKAPARLWDMSMTHAGEFLGPNFDVVIPCGLMNGAEYDTLDPRWAEHDDITLPEHGPWSDYEFDNRLNEVLVGIAVVQQARANYKANDGKPLRGKNSRRKAYNAETWFNEWFIGGHRTTKATHDAYAAAIASLSGAAENPSPDAVVVVEDP